jgi:hypothetical protein
MIAAAAWSPCSHSTAHLVRIYGQHGLRDVRYHARSIKERMEPADALHLDRVRPFDFLAGLLGLRVRLLVYGRRVPPYCEADMPGCQRAGRRLITGDGPACLLGTSYFHPASDPSSIRQVCCTLVQYTSVRKRTQFQCALPRIDFAGQRCRANRGVIETPSALRIEVSCIFPALTLFASRELDESDPANRGDQAI